ncbi:DNA invertase Pin-like site-specific DNA recombinase/transposase [Bradyrhizobium sp. USDA 4503]
MKSIDSASSEKSKNAQANLLARLSPAWLLQHQASAMTSTAIRIRKRAAIYLRYSTDHQDPYSFERQLGKGEAYAVVINVDVVKVYGDPGASGAYTANRPSYNEMLEDARQGKFDILIIEEGDRLARKLHIMTTAFATLGQYGVEIHSTKHGKWSLIHAAFSGLLSDEQRTRITELMLSGRVKILNRGLWPGRAPYGWEKIPHQPGDMRHREDQAAVIKRIVKMRLSGIPRHSIADILAREGVPPPVKEWSPEFVRRILTNPLLIGLLIFFRTEQTPIQTDVNRITVPRKVRPADQWTIAERPDWALISLDDWQKLQELDAKKIEYGPAAKFLLSKLVRCAECGGTMYCTNDRLTDTARLRCPRLSRLRYYREQKPRCSTPVVLMNTLEDVTIRFVCEKLDTPDALKQMQSAYEEKAEAEAKAMNQERETLKTERESILVRLDATFQAAITAGLTTEVVRTQRENYCARIEAIETKLASLPEISIAKARKMEPPPDSASFLSELTPMRNYSDCDESSARSMAVFRKLVGQMRVSRDKSTNEIIVVVDGPISHISGETFRYQPETRVAGRRKRANNLAKRKSHALTDEEWTTVQNALPVEDIWIEEFDSPIEFRRVVEGIIFCKTSKIGWLYLPTTFGPRRQVWAAARMLSYAGILDAVEEVMRNEDMPAVRGITLSLHSTRSKRTDPWGRFLDWNSRRKERVLARLASQEAAE